MCVKLLGQLGRLGGGLTPRFGVGHPSVPSYLKCKRHRAALVERQGSGKWHEQHHSVKVAHGGNGGRRNDLNL